MNACITWETVFTVFQRVIWLWNSNYVDMHVDVGIQLFRHVDMEKTCRPQHYKLHKKRPNFACDNYIFPKTKGKQEQTVYPFHTP